VSEKPLQRDRSKHPLGWRVRPSWPDDADAIVDLLNDVYGDWGSRDYWQWKYQQPPAPFRLTSAVADLNGQIIGHYGIVPLEAVLNGKTVRGAQVVDAAVLPTYRRRGIFTALARYVLDHAAQVGVTLIYAFPGLFSLAMNHRLGFSSVAFVPEMVRVLQPRRALATVLRLLPGDVHALWTVRREMFWSPDTVRRLARLRRSLLLLASWASDPMGAWSGRPRLLGGTGFKLRSADEFDTRFDALWAQVHDSVGLGVCKDASYLTWRYLLNPFGCYEITVAEHGKEVIGCLVMHHAGLRSDITELLALPGRTDVVPSLLTAAITQARRAGSIVLTAWAPVEHPYHARLRQVGFVSQRHLHWLAERWPALARWFYQVIIYARHLSLDQQAQLVACTRTWLLTMGDSDLV
jgi:GNAT superfamily N-acetyltransferase